METNNRKLAGVRWKALQAETVAMQEVVARRTLVWSQLLAEFERLVPWDVRLLSIAPTIDKNGSVLVGLSGVAASREAWLKLVALLFVDRKFSEPLPDGGGVALGDQRAGAPILAHGAVLAGGPTVNGRGAWLRLWYLWVPAGVLVLLNVIWLTGLRGALLGRGSLLAKQVSEAESGGRQARGSAAPARANRPGTRGAADEPG